MADEATTPQAKKRGPKPGTANAKHGGEAVRQKYGSAFYAEIGKKGGNSVKSGLGREHYARIGSKGGQATRDRLGVEHYSKIGRLGGAHRAGPPSDGEGAEPAV
jgi:hypothetical protein